MPAPAPGSAEEIRTAGVVARELSRLGIAHQTGINQDRRRRPDRGRSPRPGAGDPCRHGRAADRGEDRACRSPAHQAWPDACLRLHDIHTTTLIGVAAVLKELAPQLAGTIKLVFQPAEEGIGGMQAMIADGVMDGPKVDLALGFHNHPEIPVGNFGFVHGACLAAADQFDIVVRGKSGHAAYPHHAIDPIVAAAMLVAQLQTVVSREVRAYASGRGDRGCDQWWHHV